MDHLFHLTPETLFLRRDALAFGHDDRELARSLRAGVIVRVRHGAYCSAVVWRNLDEVGRYLLRCKAVMLVHRERVALSHTSAAVAHGLELFRPDLTHVHVVRLDGGNAAVRGDITYHAPRWTPEDLYWDGHRLLVTPTLAALGTASLHDVLSGVVVVDSLLHHGLAELGEVVETFKRRGHHPHSRRLQLVVRLTRPGAESVLETLLRMLFWRHQIPEPELQFNVWSDDGVLLARVDFCWPEHELLGEADGRMKYGRSLLPGQDPAEVVYAEKRREDLVREQTQMRMIRFVHDDLARPRETTRRTRRMLGLAA